MNVQELVIPAGAACGVLWILVKITLIQVEKRLEEKFAALSKQLAAAEDKHKEADKAIQEVRADLAQMAKEMPDRYQRREDAVRETAVLHAKLDALGTKMDALIMGRLHERT